ncbi:glycosyltransferase family 9 protein [Parafrankia discariae]|uniref:glycosyltransferase family 9 protein n=1 Tax=Parafrankia discariae TaxID=365528 RepID=UPI000374CDE0|nr:glycosyltransferase family 9 protein [Parafrankia discariae]
MLAGRLDLVALCALVARSHLVLSADTGVAHLATAYRKPSVVLFGPVSPAEWGPPPERQEHRALWAGHHSDPRSGTPAPGLLALTVDQVLREVTSLEQAAWPRTTSGTGP